MIRTKLVHQFTNTGVTDSTLESAVFRNVGLNTRVVADEGGLLRVHTYAVDGWGRIKTVAGAKQATTEKGSLREWA